MNFLYPSFLFALGLISVPIIIHLFNLQKLKRIEFSNLYFLKEVEESNHKKLKLKHLLILLARILFIIFLVLAFSQPFFPKQEEKTKENKQTIYTLILDNSLSMNAQKGNESLLKTAIKELHQFVEKTPKNTKFVLLTNDFNNFSNYLISKDKVLDLLTELNFSNKFKSNEQVISKLIEICNKNSIEHNNIIWISDFQKVNGDLQNLSLDTNSIFHLIPIKADKIENVMIDSVFLNKPFVMKNIPNQINIKLKNTGNHLAENKNVKVFLNDVLYSTISESIEPKSTKTIQIEFVANDTSRIKGKIEIEDYPISFDNEHYFNIQPTKKINIYVISDTLQNELHNIYNQEDVFKVSMSTSSQINYESLNNAQVLIINKLKSNSEVIQAIVSDFLENGGNVVYIPRTNLKEKNLNFINFNKIITNNILINNQIYEHPFFDGVFEKNTTKTTMPEVEKYYLLSNYDQLILQTLTNHPFLVSKKISNGNFYAFSTDISKYSNLYQHSLVVPIFYRIAMLSDKNNQKLYYKTTDQNINITLREKTTNEIIYSIYNDKISAIPIQRINGNVLIIGLNTEITNNLSNGFYNIGTSSKTISNIALNSDSKESDLEPIDISVISEKLPNNKQMELNQLNTDFINSNTLWKYCLILSMLFLFIEILIIKMYKK